MAPKFEKIDLITKSKSVFLSSNNNRRTYSFIIDATIADQLTKLYGPLPELVEQLLCELLISNLKSVNANEN